MVRCKLCDSKNVHVEYHGPIKTGLLGGLTEESCDVYKCDDCGTIWHNMSDIQTSEYYESETYRKNIEKTSEIGNYYQKHDKEVLFKLQLTGTDIFRDKVVADVGCGGGSFLDYISGVAKEIIAIEPSRTYRKTLSEKGYHTYAYAQDAMAEWEGKVDVLVSFDVIEHVKDPRSFLKDSYSLLKKDGLAIIGTPTDYPVLRKMLGDRFNQFIFQIHHPWVLSEKSVGMIAKEVGFKEIDVSTIQKYGIGNLLYWLRDGKPYGDIKCDFIDSEVDRAYRESMGVAGRGEYIVLRSKK